MIGMLRKNMKVVIYVVVIAFVATSFLAYIGTRGQNNSQNQAAYAQNYEPIATVNGEEVSYQVHNSLTNRYLSQYQGQVNPQQLDFFKVGFKAQALDRLIDQNLLLQEADKADIDSTVSEEEIQQRIDQLIEQTGSRENLEKALQAQGGSIKAYKEQLKEAMPQTKKIQGMIDQVTANISVSDEEYQEALSNLAKSEETVTASHILISTEDKSDAEAKAKAEKVLAKVRSEEDFATLAKEYSEGSSSTRGGSLGSFSRGQMVKPFEETAFAMEAGEVSDLVKTQFGYHIIKVTAKNADVRDKVESQKKQEVLDSWLEEVKVNSEIVINDQAILGFKAAQAGNLEEAAKNYKAAIASNPNNYYLYYNLVQVYIQDENTDKAIAALTEATDKYPGRSSFYQTLAGLYQQEEKLDEAIEVYQKALENNEDDMQLHFSLADLYKKVEKQDEAIAEYEKMSELAGDNSGVHKMLAEVYNKMGLKEKADAELEKVKEIQKKKQELLKEEKKNSEQE